MQLDENAKKIYNKIPRGSKIAFFTTLIFGLLAHMYLLTNRLPINDDMYQMVYNMDYSTSGRWFLKYLAAITTDFSLPWINGMVSIIVLGISAGIISWIFKMKGFMTNAVFAAFMVTFPALSEMMLFINNVDADMIALLFSTLAFMLLTKKWYFVPVAIVLSVLSLATYQLYFIFTIAISVIYLIYKIVEDDIEYKKLGALILKMGITFIVSGISYLYITKNLIPTPLSDYQGLNEMGSLGFKQILGGIYSSYGEFSKFISFSGILDYYYSYLKFPFVLSIAISLILLGYNATKKNVSLLKSLIALALIFALPLAINLIYVVRSEAGYMAFRMLFNYALVVFFITLALDLMYRNNYYLKRKDLANINAKNDNIYTKNNKVDKKALLISDMIKMSTGVIILTLSFMVYNNITISNQLYFKVEMDFRNGTEYTNRLINKIENLEEYDTDKKVYIIGSPDSRTDFWYDYWIKELSGFSMPNTMTEIWTYDLFMERYFGFPNDVKVYPGVNEEEQDSIPDDIKEEVRKMPLYPNKGSIKVWDNKILVNGRNIYD